MEQSELFKPLPKDTPPDPVSGAEIPLGTPRVLRPDRQQMRFMPTDLESLLAEDHPARAIWAVVEKLDLAKFEATVKAREGHAGRPGIDARILVTLLHALAWRKLRYGLAALCLGGGEAVAMVVEREG